MSALVVVVVTLGEAGGGASSSVHSISSDARIKAGLRANRTPSTVQQHQQQQQHRRDSMMSDLSSGSHVMMGRRFSSNASHRRRVPPPSLIGASVTTNNNNSPSRAAGLRAHNDAVQNSSDDDTKFGLRISRTSTASSGGSNNTQHSGSGITTQDSYTEETIVSRPGAYRQSTVNGLGVGIPEQEIGVWRIFFR